MTDHGKYIGFVLEALTVAAQEEGHTFLYRTEIEARLRAYGLGLTAVTVAIATAERNGFVVVRGDAVYLKDLEEVEQTVADKVKVMLGEGRT